ncbi:hypothetical protein D7B12_18025 [Salmonella enterica]|nr:hypothetical protein [Salmonella enterica]
MDFKRVKKRYIVGVIVVVFLLWQCTDSEDEQYESQRNEQMGSIPAAVAGVGQQSQYAPAPQQPIIVNTQPQQSHDHFWDYMMLHHLFSHHNSQPDYQGRERNVTNVRNITNVTNVTKNSASPAATKSGYQATIKQSSSKWSQPSAIARSYSVSAPAASSMKTKTWATNSGKGWGSSSYKSSSTSYSYKSSRSFSSSRRR